MDIWLGQATLSVASGLVLHFLGLKFHHTRHPSRLSVMRTE